MSNGCIEVICGCMFAGKTEELIRRIRSAELARQKVKVFKPEKENRYNPSDIVSHNSESFNASPVKEASQILDMTGDEEVVGIDEAQFFDEGIIDVCNALANKGLRVIVAGLDMDFRGEPFGPVPSLMAVAEKVTKLNAVCAGCGNPAHFSHRKCNNDEQFMLGEKDVYEPLCRSCFGDFFF